MQISSFRARLAPLASLFALSALLRPALAEVRYRIDLIPPPFNGVTHPAGLNNLGQVVGYARDNSGGQQAFVYANGVTQAIPVIQGESAKYAVGINNSGVVVGYTSPQNPNTGEYVFTYHNGVQTTVGQVPPGFQTFAVGINDAGQIAGYDFGSGNPGDRAFLYTSGTWTNLGTIEPARDSLGFALNNLGDVVGAIGTNGANRPFIVTAGGTPRYIGTQRGRALGMNDQRVVVGFSEVSRRGFYYEDASGTFRDIAPIAGPEVRLTDVNNLGQAVATPAALYTPASGLVNLNSLIDPASGWDLIDAYAINDVGQIIGLGTIGNGPAGFILTPVPEPSCALASVIVIIVMRRVRRRE